jgi:flavodoxin
MAKKSLIIYVSFTGNTEKVAMKMKEVFEKRVPGAIGSAIRLK